MSNYQYDYLVYIGRFQPYHNGHHHVIKEALKYTKRLIVLVGSSNASRSPRNPFTAVERTVMIFNALINDKSIDESRVLMGEVGDYPYNDTAWLTSVKTVVGNLITQTTAPEDVHKKRIGIVGFEKDRSSDYLNWFKNWGRLEVKEYQNLSSTHIREQYFDPYYRIPTEDHVPHQVSTFLKNFVTGEEFKWILDYHKADLAAIKTYGKGPHLCADSLVLHRDRILLIQRKYHPGKGLLALPGGHLNVGETLINCSVRELREETALADKKGELPPGKVKSFITDSRLFDSPDRSTRGRVITQCFKYTLPEQDEFFVKGSDDAATAQWYDLASLKSTQMFEDHSHIVSALTGVKIKG